MRVDQLAGLVERHGDRVDGEVAAGEIARDPGRARPRAAPRVGVGLRSRARRCRSAPPVSHRRGPEAVVARGISPPSAAASLERVALDDDVEVGAARRRAARRAPRRRPGRRRLRLAAPRRAPARRRAAPRSGPRGLGVDLAWQRSVGCERAADAFPTMTAFADGPPARRSGARGACARACSGRGRGAASPSAPAARSPTIRSSSATATSAARRRCELEAEEQPKPRSRSRRSTGPSTATTTSARATCRPKRVKPPFDASEWSFQAGQAARVLADRRRRHPLLPSTRTRSSTRSTPTRARSSGSSDIGVLGASSPAYSRRARLRGHARARRRRWRCAPATARCSGRGRSPAAARPRRSSSART